MAILIIPDVHGTEHWKKTKEIDGILTEKTLKNNGKLLLIDSAKHKNITMLDTKTEEYGLVLKTKYLT